MKATVVKITKRISQFLKVMLVSIVTFMPLASHADDTEVYLGATTNTIGVQPNVLFILDTSGSMGSTIGGGDSTVRMVAMKNAMTQILSTSNNLNVGLMSFNGRGGPVRLPVRDIDAALNVDEGFQVVRSITQSTDDAQQVDESGAAENGEMDLDNDYIYLSVAPSVSSTTTSLTIPIATAADENDESISSGYQYPYDNSFWINSSYIAGLRFQNVNVPQGVDIVNAQLRMTAFNDSTPPINEVRITGEDVDNSTSLLGTGVINSRYTSNSTSNDLDWIFSGIARNQEVYTDNIEHIIEEIVGRAGWTSGNALTLFLDSSTVTGEFYGYAPHYSGHPSTTWPELEIEYVSSTGGGAGKRSTGLRFQDVRIPQGATITEAYFSVKSSTTSNEPVQFVVQAELDDDSQTFTSTDGNITSRAKTGYKLWNLTNSDAWVSGERYFSPDIKDVVQNVVNQGSWCGGNALSLLLRDANKDDARRFYTYDGAFNKVDDVPTLHVKYDVSGISSGETGCTLRTITKRIEASEDDVEERTSDGQVQLNSGDLNVGQRRIGLRFPGIALPQGADILSANIEFTAAYNRTGTTSATFHGEDIDTSPLYSGGTKYQVRDRINSRSTAATVSWSGIPNATAGQTYVSPDLTGIVQEIVNRGGWNSGNPMGFMMDANGGLRYYRSYNGNAIEAPRLTVEARVNLTSSSVEGETVRDQLISEVNSLVASGGTPITDVLYEGIQYYRGDDVDWGKERGWGSWWARVSHPDTYENASGVYRNSGCTDSNLNDSDCASEEIQGSANYISPLDNACQANYIVLLTDGSQNSFYGKDKINSLTGGSCTSDSSSNVNNNCGFELAEYAHTQDLSTNETGSNNLPGTQTTNIYTIGFTANASPTYMQGLADNGGGKYFQANDADQLVDVFKQITQDILSQPSTFTSPSLTVNAFNQLYNTNDVYVSLFEPALEKRWDGNLKKYQLCINGENEIIICDANNKGISDPVTNVIRDDAESLWGGIDDGPEIKLSGAGSQLQTPANRRLFTYTDAAAPSGVDLGLNKHLLKDSNSNLDTTLLGVVSNADRKDLIDWIRGEDTEGDNDGPNPNTRWGYADALHSSAATVTYGGTSSNPADKLIVGTNDGFIRMINAYNGQEEWAFMPQEMLQNQVALRTNSQSDRLYGIDGSPVIWRYDDNFNGVIEPATDFVRAFVNMRRGGNNIYALDITPDTVISDASKTDQVTPELMWRIEGGSGDYARLGQTWSEPILTSIRMTESGDVVEKDVLIFAGGYDTAYDSGTTTTNNIGNAIYIVDALTGERIWWASNSGSGAAVQVPGMDYAIPSAVRLLDMDLDGNKDRIIVGDLGGNIWRFDLQESLKKGVAGGAIGHKLASLGHAENPSVAADDRRIMNPVQVALIEEDVLGGTESHLLMVVGTGNRPKPVSNTTENRLFVLKDFQLATLPDVDGNGLADSTAVTIKDSDLYDAYSQVYSPDGNAPTGLAGKLGWYFDLKDSTAGFIGEKAISGGVLVKTNDTDAPFQYIFSTYLPPGATATSPTVCGTSLGSSRTYVLSLAGDTVGEPTEPPTVCPNCAPPPCLACGGSATATVTPQEPEICLENCGGGTAGSPPGGGGKGPLACADDVSSVIVNLGESVNVNVSQCYHPSYWIKN